MERIADLLPHCSNCREVFDEGRKLLTAECCHAFCEACAGQKNAVCSIDQKEISNPELLEGFQDLLNSVKSSEREMQLKLLDEIYDRICVVAVPCRYNEKCLMMKLCRYNHQAKQSLQTSSCFCSTCNIRVTQSTVFCPVCYNKIKDSLLDDYMVIEEDPDYVPVSVPSFWGPISFLLRIWSHIRSFLAALPKKSDEMVFIS